jgi:hypothetical protein
MFPFDLLEAVPQGVQEVLIGIEDRPIHLKLNHSLRFSDSGDLAGVVCCLQFGPGDIGSELHHFVNPAIKTENGVIGRSQPDFLPAFTQPFVLASLRNTLVQLGPELLPPVGSVQKHAVMLALDFLQPVAHQVQKELIGNNDRPISLKLDVRPELGQALDFPCVVARYLILLKFPCHPGCCHFILSFYGRATFSPGQALQTGASSPFEHHPLRH